MDKHKLSLKIHILQSYQLNEWYNNYHDNNIYKKPKPSTDIISINRIHYLDNIEKIIFIFIIKPTPKGTLNIFLYLLFFLPLFFRKKYSPN